MKDDKNSKNNSPKEPQSMPDEDLSRPTGSD